MGTTPKPLTIIVLPPVDTWPEVAELEAQKHTIIRYYPPNDIPWDKLADADVILGPQCWRMDEQHRKYLKLAVEEARRARYPVKGKKNA